MGIKKWKLLDLDDIFAYRTPRTVKIRDRKLGIARITMVLAIVLYVVVYEVIIQKGYLVKERPAGFFARVSLRNARWSSLPPGTTSLPYCCGTVNCQATSFASARGGLPCMVLGDYDTIVPPSEDNAGFITSRVTVTRYAPRPASCVANVQVAGLSCGPWVVDASLAVNTSAVNVQAGASIAHYVAGTEDHTVLIRHAIYGRENDLALESVRDMPKARLRDSDGDYVKNFCDLQNTGDMGITCTDSGNEASKNRPGDIMSMSELFEAAGMPRTGGVAGVSSDLYLDRTEESADTLRYNGIVLLIIVDYAGTSVGEDTVKYSYHVKHVPVVEYKYEEVKDYSYTDSVTGVMMVRREVWNRHGVRIIVVHAGWMGKFSFVELLKTLVTGLALLALAGTLTDYVVMRLLPNADVYRRYKNVRTIDFSDLKPDTRELKDDKKLTWGGRHLTDEVFVYGELDKDEKELSDETRKGATGDTTATPQQTSPDTARKGGEASPPQQQYSTPRRYDEPRSYDRPKQNPLRDYEVANQNAFHSHNRNRI